MRRYCISCVLLLLGLAFSAKAQSADELERAIGARTQELDSINAELTQRQLLVESLGKEEKSHLERLYLLEEQLNLNSRLITKITKQIKDLAELLVTLEANLEESQFELAEHEEILLQRLVLIYKRSRISPLEAVLDAGSLLAGARRLHQFSLLNRYDRQFISDMRALSEKIVVEKTDLAKTRASVIKLKQENERQDKIIREDRKRRKDLLGQVRAQKDAGLQAIHQLEEDQSRIASIIDILLENKSALDREAALAFQALRGRLLWPVFGRVIRQFGRITDDRYKTSTLNPGIDIEARAGSPVSAASSGAVAYVSWLRGYGSFVILEHGGGYYTLYAHLDDILVERGQPVTAGDLLGTVGETGSLGGPMLHFELRYGKEQVDPVPWLR